eukprot:CAMPEP_0175053288 /NCGR_PEP_ID=MMETSP0052_2-20121109/8839_1 /TAXON_ID=51329 ORGANISM="Polytomella parva, Strain SAG 63-3" /NCGR_SAMPLE_ID=MMETSP0052_2 /ASSEMBLY_ACC=CAM_ASM_000194 /LENGTH=771 /DNA_ID=CAMNT_0016317801 /DNA_START=142 /DNA_END=2457 /DNA_ORIENTATION=+
MASLSDDYDGLEFVEDEYNLVNFSIYQAIPVPEGDPDWSQEVPDTVEEYLKRVRFEAKTMPKVFRKDIDLSKTKDNLHAISSEAVFLSIVNEDAKEVQSLKEDGSLSLISTTSTACFKPETVGNSSSQSIPCEASLAFVSSSISNSLMSHRSKTIETASDKSKVALRPNSDWTSKLLRDFHSLRNALIRQRCKWAKYPDTKPKICPPSPYKSKAWIDLCFSCQSPSPSSVSFPVVPARNDVTGSGLGCCDTADHGFLNLYKSLDLNSLVGMNNDWASTNSFESVGKDDQPSMERGSPHLSMYLYSAYLDEYGSQVVLETIMNEFDSQWSKLDELQKTASQDFGSKVFLGCESEYLTVTRWIFFLAAGLDFPPLLPDASAALSLGLRRYRKVRESLEALLLPMNSEVPSLDGSNSIIHQYLVMVNAMIIICGAYYKQDLGLIALRDKAFNDWKECDNVAKEKRVENDPPRNNLIKKKVTVSDDALKTNLSTTDPYPYPSPLRFEGSDPKNGLASPLSTRDNSSFVSVGMIYESELEPISKKKQKKSTSRGNKEDATRKAPNAKENSVEESKEKIRAEGKIVRKEEKEKDKKDGEREKEKKVNKKKDNDEKRPTQIENNKQMKLDDSDTGKEAINVPYSSFAKPSSSKEDKAYYELLKIRLEEQLRTSWNMKIQTEIEDLKAEFCHSIQRTISKAVRSAVSKAALYYEQKMSEQRHKYERKSRKMLKKYRKALQSQATKMEKKQAEYAFIISEMENVAVNDQRHEASLQELWE